MPLTAHDILMDAGLFRAAYPNWPGAETSPLDGPHLTGRELTDYSDEPGYAILPAAREDRNDEEG